MNKKIEDFLKNKNGETTDQFFISKIEKEGDEHGFSALAGNVDHNLLIHTIVACYNALAESIPEITKKIPEPKTKEQMTVVIATLASSVDMIFDDEGNYSETVSDMLMNAVGRSKNVS